MLGAFILWLAGEKGPGVPRNRGGGRVKVAREQTKTHTSGRDNKASHKAGKGTMRAITPCTCQKCLANSPVIEEKLLKNSSPCSITGLASSSRSKRCQEKSTGTTAHGTESCV